MNTSTKFRGQNQVSKFRPAPKDIIEKRLIMDFIKDIPLQAREGKRFSEDFQMAINILKKYGYIEYDINYFFDENIRRSKEFIIRLNTNM